MEKCVLPRKVLEAAISYLITRPYQEVAEILNHIRAEVVFLPEEVPIDKNGEH